MAAKTARIIAVNFAPSLHNDAGPNDTVHTNFERMVVTFDCTDAVDGSTDTLDVNVQTAINARMRDAKTRHLRHACLYGAAMTSVGSANTPIAATTSVAGEVVSLVPCLAADGSTPTTIAAGARFTRPFSIFCLVSATY